MSSVNEIPNEINFDSSPRNFKPKVRCICNWLVSLLDNDSRSRRPIRSRFPRVEMIHLGNHVMSLFLDTQRTGLVSR